MSRSKERAAITADGRPSQIPDSDPEETSEWLESLDGLLDSGPDGRHRVRFVMLKLLERARERRVGLPALRSSDYINTIPAAAEADFRR